jgi:hypothetical protein
MVATRLLVFVGAMLRHDPPFNRSNHRLQGLKLRRKHDQSRTRIDREAFILFIGNDRQQLLEPLLALCRHNPQFGHVRPQSIDCLGPLPQQQIARAVLHQPALLLGQLYLYKAHGRAAHRLADRCRVGCIVLLRLT